MASVRRKKIPQAVTQISDESLLIEAFAKRLHKIIADKGMSPSDLARKVWGSIEQIDNRTGRVVNAARNRDRISVYLAGKGFPDPKNLAKIAKVLGTTPEELAPDITAAAIEREIPEMNMTVIAGNEEKALLRINKLMPVDLAIEILRLIREKTKVNKNEEE